MSPALDVTKLERGTVLIGKYRVVRTLGVGGMGVVVACEHLTLGSRVALKFLLPQFLANPGIAKRFVREAQAAIRITSEHVARVMDVDLLPDGLPFMVMEYLQGKDLAALVDAGRRFGIEESIDYVTQAAEALAQAHHVGVVHRDIKPANIFLVHRGEDLPLVKVLDFGISKMLDEPDSAAFQRGLTKTTTVLGSGLYMSPEQMRSAKTVDHRTDIYALGIVLFELLSHTQPYTAESFADLAVRVSTEPPDPLTRHRPDVSEELARVIERAYARKQEDRYSTVSDFVTALAPFASPETLPLIESIHRIGAGRGRGTGGILTTTGPDRDGADGEPRAATPRTPTTGGSEGSLARASTAMAATAPTGGSTTLATGRSVTRRLAPWLVLGLAAAGGAIAASFLLGDPLVGSRGKPAATASTGAPTATDSSTDNPDAATSEGSAQAGAAGGGGAPVADPLVGGAGPDDAGATRRVPTVTITSDRSPTPPGTTVTTSAPSTTTKPWPAPPYGTSTTTPATPPAATSTAGTGPSNSGPCFRKDPDTGAQQMVPCE